MYRPSTAAAELGRWKLPIAELIEQSLDELWGNWQSAMQTGRDGNIDTSDISDFEALVFEMVSGELIMRLSIDQRKR